MRAAVTDWKPMRGTGARSLRELESNAAAAAGRRARRRHGLPRWLADNHFTFLGYRSHDLVTIDGEDALQRRAGLGPRHPARATRSKDVAASFAALPPRGARLRAPAGAAGHHQVDVALDRASARAISTTSQSSASTRRARCAASTASSACSPRPRTARARPRSRCCGARSPNVLARAGLAAGQPRRARRSLNILEPIRATSCSRPATTSCCAPRCGILHLGDRQRFRLFVRRDPFERFVSCLIYAPRENYTTELRQKWQAILMQAFNGIGSEFNVHPVRVGAGAHAHHRAHDAGAHSRRSTCASSKRRLVAAARRWDDDLKAALIAALGESARQRAAAPVRRRLSRPATARSSPARAAVPDIEMMRRAGAETQPLGMQLYRPLEAPPGVLRFKLFQLGGR